MVIDQFEQQYQSLSNDFEAGRIDEPTFLAALDDLQFQDRRGRYWMIGCRTGAWYCYDGQTWRQADPRQLDGLPAEGGQTGLRQVEAVEWPGEQPEIDVWGDAEPPLSATVDILPARSQNPHSLSNDSVVAPIKPMLVMGIALLAVLVFLVWPVGSAPPPGGPDLAPSPRPPIDTGDGGGSGGGGGGGRGGDSGSAASGSKSAIVGTLTDLSTGQPGAGIEVSVSGSIVRTDTDGSYSITGLPAGEYVVAPDLSGQGQAAHGPIHVNVDGQNSVTVDLAYQSRQLPQPTDTPQPEAVAAAATPDALPGAGGPVYPGPFILVGFGLLSILIGVGLRHHHKHRVRS